MNEGGNATPTVHLHSSSVHEQTAAEVMLMPSSRLDAALLKHVKAATKKFRNLRNGM